ncbi:conserved hypothetical protein [Histoplasma capsulatum var. duboisii H88]|uniref:HCP-like protein n=1 Tax=Ajellomyces capsulatus (strain H88) TaxID=544711 RepID=F0UEK7_AJEC8|nr:conserved hypothetical protein [Histoplasma capsulatum var. duboisii H88]
MALKDLLKKKDKIKDDDTQQVQQHQQPQRYSQQEPFPPPPHPPEFKFFRSDTYTTESIQPPGQHQAQADSHSHPFHPESQSRSESPTSSNPSSSSRSPFSRLHRLSNVSSAGASENSPSQELSPAQGEKRERRLSQRLHLNRASRSASTSSVNLPSHLPQIAPDTGDAQDREAQWEKRATIMVKGGLNGTGIGPASPRGDIEQQKEGDENIQEAIRLHENGQLAESTRMFGKLADPNGANNALSQVLYGLALRHGWGCAPDPEKAITYLSAAASNSASIEAEALSAGMKKGGAAKGELVLAMYELANCFRNGWGVAKDPVAARHYYETAANLGDTDAMNEAAWCYLEGFGGKKDRVSEKRREREALLPLLPLLPSDFIGFQIPGIFMISRSLQEGSKYHVQTAQAEESSLRLKLS